MIIIIVHYTEFKSYSDDSTSTLDNLSYNIQNISKTTLETSDLQNTVHSLTNLVSAIYAPILTQGSKCISEYAESISTSQTINPLCEKVTKQFISSADNQQLFWDPAVAVFPDSPAIGNTPSTNFLKMTTWNIGSTTATIRATNTVACSANQFIIARVAIKKPDGNYMTAISKTNPVNCSSLSTGVYMIPLSGLLPNCTYNYILQTSTGSSMQSVVGRFSTFPDELSGYWNPITYSSGYSSSFFWRSIWSCIFKQSYFGVFS